MKWVSVFRDDMSIRHLLRELGTTLPPPITPALVSLVTLTLEYPFLRVIHGSMGQFRVGQSRAPPNSLTTGGLREISRCSTDSRDARLVYN